ncbi:MAG: hypothetical protein ACJA09_003029 [Alcanivorax sp.]|jgi:hypothetical protein
MTTYKRQLFPPDIISYAAWLYYRFNLRRVVTATEISKISSLSGASPYPEKQSAFGVSSSVRFIHAA